MSYFRVDSKWQSNTKRAEEQCQQLETLDKDMKGPQNKNSSVTGQRAASQARFLVCRVSVERLNPTVLKTRVKINQTQGVTQTLRPRFKGLCVCMWSFSTKQNQTGSAASISHQQCLRKKITTSHSKINQETLYNNKTITKQIV